MEKENEDLTIEDILGIDKLPQLDGFGALNEVSNSLMMFYLNRCLKVSSRELGDTYGLNKNKVCTYANQGLFAYNQLVLLMNLIHTHIGIVFNYESDNQTTNDYKKSIAPYWVSCVNWDKIHLLPIKL